MSDVIDHLVLGAGVAGLTLARRLADAGRRVVVLDKGRGPGGRLSTRRETVAGAELRFDHGAQYLTAREASFRAEVEKWVAAGVVAEWKGRFAKVAGGVVSPEPPPVPRYVGVPGMSALCRHLAQGLDVRYSRRAQRLERTTAGVRVHAVSEDGTHEVEAFDARRVSVAVPDVQARQLLGELLPLPATHTAPCWALLLAFPEKLATAFDAARVEGAGGVGGVEEMGGPIRWLARESSKPRRAHDEAWVIHVSPEWSTAQLELTPDEVAPKLLAAFASVVGTPLPTPTVCKAHRWRYALTTTPAGTPFAATDDLALSACGDYLLGGKIEAAFLSGARLADRLI